MFTEFVFQKQLQKYDNAKFAWPCVLLFSLTGKLNLHIFYFILADLPSCKRSIKRSIFFTLVYGTGCHPIYIHIDIQLQHIGH